MSTGSQEILPSLSGPTDKAIEKSVAAFRDNYILYLLLDSLPPPPLTIAIIPGAIELTESAICGAQIVSAWTMFEALSADLWVATVNAFPNPLGHLAARGKRISTKIDEGGKEPSTPKKIDLEKFTLKDLALMCKKDFNLSESMGDLLRQSELVKFIKLSGIRDAYAAAFPENDPGTSDIEAALSSIALDELAVIRNLLVHAAGKADKKYCDDDCKRLPNLPRLTIDQPYPLNKTITRQMITPVAECSQQLIKGVEAWIKASRQKTT